MFHSLIYCTYVWLLCWRKTMRYWYMVYGISTKIMRAYAILDLCLPLLIWFDFHNIWIIGHFLYLFDSFFIKVFLELQHMKTFGQIRSDLRLAVVENQSLIDACWMWVSTNWSLCCRNQPDYDWQWIKPTRTKFEIRFDNWFVEFGSWNKSAKLELNIKFVN
jgi:hypothetical protein